jgi:hypothetical protein
MMRTTILDVDESIGKRGSPSLSRPGDPQRRPSEVPNPKPADPQKRPPEVPEPEPADPPRRPPDGPDPDPEDRSGPALRKNK